MERHHGTEREDMDSESDRDERAVDDDTITESDGSTRPRDIFDDVEDGSDESSVENDDEDSDDDDLPQPGRDRIVNNVYAELINRREAVIDYLVGQGKDEEEAKEEAYESMLPTYQKQGPWGAPKGPQHAHKKQTGARRAGPQKGLTRAPVISTFGPRCASEKAQGAQKGPS